MDGTNEISYLMSQLGFLDREMFAAYLRKAYGRSDNYKGFVDDYITHSLDWIYLFKSDPVDKIRDAVEDNEYLFFQDDR
ncbi:hypothetical protein [Faecalibaculum rodentium]|uniref:hypothetical protein n=1 Tax=Faecalibaculum rodentium TaxID=1702221 RepID=UPI0023F136EB|nr:hypothetical protein [Faecalibaculum rodentium]